MMQERKTCVRCGEAWWRVDGSAQKPLQALASAILGAVEYENHEKLCDRCARGLIGVVSGYLTSKEPTP